MKIGIDAGSLCGPKSGNRIFTSNLIQALINLDKKNQYFLYSFCKNPIKIRFPSNFIYKVLRPSFFWMKGAVTINQNFNKTDIFLGLNQAFPYSFSKKIIFSHGLSFIYFKSLYPKHYKKFNYQLKNMLEKANTIVVSSIKVKKEFNKLFKKKIKIKVLNFGIPQDFLTTKNVVKKNYFLNVGANQPIKNINFLVNCFNQFIKTIDSSYKLYLITDKKYKLSKSKNIIQISNISRKKLKRLYMYSKAYLSTSLYESFNFPILEALSQNTQVIALKGSYIPEMQKYIYKAQNQKEFIDHMKGLRDIKNKIKVNEIRKNFSWNKYVEELIKMY